MQIPIFSHVNRWIAANADIRQATANAILARVRSSDHLESMSNAFAVAERSFLNGMRDVERDLDDMDRHTYLVQALRASIDDSFISNGLNNWVNYVIGTGAIIQSQNEAATDQWDAWRKVNKFDKKEKEICRRGARDGDAFIRFFGAGPEMLIRFIDSEAIVEPHSTPGGLNWSLGIATMPDDVESVVAYWRLRDVNDSNSGEIIPADEVLHYGFRWESTSKFGVGLLRAALKVAKQLDIELDYLHALLKVRLAVAMTEKVHAAPSGISSGGLGDDTSGRRTDNSNYVKALKPGTVLSTNAGTEHAFISPNLDGPDMEKIFAYQGRRIAAAYGQPEYMVTADASNNNRAGSIVAGSPFFKSVSSERADGIGPIILEIYQRVTGDMTASVEWPRLDSGNRSEDATALMPAVLNGTLDNKTYLEEIDIDPDKVAERLEQQEDGRGADEEDFRIARERDAGDDVDGDGDESGEGQ